MSKKIKRGISILACIAIIGGGFYIYKTYITPTENVTIPAIDKQANKRKPLSVSVQILKKETLTEEIAVSGLLLPDEEVDLSFETSGKITQINFEEGARVKKGDILAKVNDATLQAQLRKLEVQLQLAEDRVYRQNALLEKEAVSKEAYEQVQTDLATLQAEIEMVKANIALTELKAPFDGRIGLRHVSEGAYATPSTLVANLTKISPLKIEFAVPERYAGEIKDGTNLDFSIEGHLRPFKAKVYATESHVDSEIHTFSMRALYPNTQEELTPGRYASVRLKTREIKNAIAIPSEAIVPEMGIDKVFLYKSGKAIPVTITKGLRTEAKVQVLKGLSVGDTIITSGTLQLRTDLPVTIQNIEK